MKKLYLRMNAIMLVLILIFDLCYMFGGGLVVKGITSSLFVITGVINFIYIMKNKKDLKFPIWMMIALVCAMVADIILGLNFYLGTILFALGHVFYSISYTMLDKFNRRDILYGMLISIIAISVILFTPFLDFGNHMMQMICCMYGIIISFMVGKAISNLMNNKNTINGIIMVGSILFVFSDLMLVLDKFGDMDTAGYFCLGTYYPAQFLLAFSLFIYASKKS